MFNFLRRCRVTNITVRAVGSGQRVPIAIQDHRPRKGTRFTAQSPCHFGTVVHLAGVNFQRDKVVGK
jgi:hypothetical protein